MTIKQFIEKAIEGGWKPSTYDDRMRLKNVTAMGAYFWYPKRDDLADILIRTEPILLDPEAWKALGKLEGWATCDDDDPECIRTHAGNPIYHMHRMIDSLAEGHTIEEFLATL